MKNLKVTILSSMLIVLAIFAATSCALLSANNIQIILGPQGAVIGAVITFSLTSPSNEGYQYFWLFGDGNTATGNPVSHIYGQPGTYPVEVKVGILANNTQSIAEAENVVAIITYSTQITIAGSSNDFDYEVSITVDSITPYNSGCGGGGQVGVNIFNDEGDPSSIVTVLLADVECGVTAGSSFSGKQLLVQMPPGPTSGAAPFEFNLGQEYKIRIGIRGTELRACIEGGPSALAPLPVNISNPPPFLAPALNQATGTVTITELATSDCTP